jgi:hypothetical protein
MTPETRSVRDLFYGAKVFIATCVFVACVAVCLVALA